MKSTDSAPTHNTASATYARYRVPRTAVYSLLRASAAPCPATADRTRVPATLPRASLPPAQGPGTRSWSRTPARPRPPARASDVSFHSTKCINQIRSRLPAHMILHGLTTSQRTKLAISPPARASPGIAARLLSIPPIGSGRGPGGVWGSEDGGGSRALGGHRWPTAGSGRERSCSTLQHRAQLERLDLRDRTDRVGRGPEGVARVRWLDVVCDRLYAPRYLQ